MCRVDKTHARQLDYRGLFGNLGRYDRVAEIHDLVPTGKAHKRILDNILQYLPDVITELAVNKDVSFLVANNNNTCHDVFFGKIVSH